MNIGTMIKRLQDIMRQDAGINGDAQRIEQIVWMLFLKLYDSKEMEWEIYEDNYKSIIPENYRWRNWAIDNKDGKAMTGDELVNLFQELSDICTKLVSSHSSEGDTKSAALFQELALKTSKAYTSKIKTINTSVN